LIGHAGRRYLPRPQAAPLSSGLRCSGEDPCPQVRHLVLVTAEEVNRDVLAFLRQPALITDPARRPGLAAQSPMATSAPTDRQQRHDAAVETTPPQTPTLFELALIKSPPAARPPRSARCSGTPADRAAQGPSTPRPPSVAAPRRCASAWTSSAATRPVGFQNSTWAW
jgi:hypothetical protein